MNALTPSSGRSPWPVRIGLFFSVAIYLVYSSLGILAPFFWGHYGYHGAIYTLRARMSLRLHTLAPTTWSGFDKPPLNSLYFHHPIGYHHLLTLLVPIFGEHEWLPRVVAVLGGLVALYALYKLVKRAWCRELAMVSVMFFIALPIITTFSVLSDPMLLMFACTCWSLWSYLALIEAEDEAAKKRALLHAAASYALSGLLMWEAYFLAPFIALHAIAFSFTARGKILRMRFLGREMNALYAHILTIGSACVAMMAFHIWYTHFTGAWPDFMESFHVRSAPPSAHYVIDRHTLWLKLLYGVPPVAIGLLWLAIWIVRAATGRSRLRDLLPLSFFYLNTLYIFLFAEGSAVHLYRVFVYSGFFTLSAVDLLSSAMAMARKIGSQRWLAPMVAFVLFGGYLIVELPHSYKNLLDGRAFAGTLGENYPGTQFDKAMVAMEATRMTTPSERVIVHYGHLGARKEMWYYLDRSFDEVTTLPQINKYHATWAKSVLMLDFSALSPSEQPFYDELVRKHPVTYYDHYAIVDLRSNKPGASSYEFVPQPMSASYKWWVSRKWPPLKIERIAYMPGFCHALQLGIPISTDEVLPPPPAQPALRACYANLLLDRGSSRAANDAVNTTVAQMRAVPLGDSTIYVGQIVRGRLELFFKPSGPAPTLSIVHQLTTEGDTQVHKTTPPATVPPSAKWKAGHLYADEVFIPPGKPNHLVISLMSDIPSAPPIATADLGALKR